MRWRILSGDVNWETYGGKLISPPQNNGEFDYWLVLEVNEWEAVVGEREAAEIDGTHNVSLSVVVPSECPTEDYVRAFDSCGWEGMEVDHPEMLVNLLHSYGIRATIWDENGNLRDLLRDAKRQADITAGITFGFAMDCPQNRMGATGWDTIQGNLVPQ